MKMSIYPIDTGFQPEQSGRTVNNKHHADLHAGSAASNTSVAALCLLALSACTTPDVKPEIGAINSAVGAASKEFRLIIEADYKRQAALLREQYIGDFKTVYASSPGCALVYADAELPADTGAAGSNDSQNCEIVAFYQPELDSTTAAKASILVDMLEAYFAGLTLLAQSEQPKAIGDALTKLIDETMKLASATETGGLIKLATDLKGASSAASLSATFLAKQAQYRALRRAVNRGEPAVQFAGDILVAYFQTREASNLSDAFANINAAEARMLDARKSGNAGRYRKAVGDFEKSVVAFNDVRQRSKASAVSSIVDAHSELVERLRKPRSAEEFLALFGQIKAIRDAVAKI